MAIKRKAGGRITGLAADPKPTAAAEPVNTTFEETDTLNEYINNGTAWVIYRAGMTMSADWIIYKSGTETKRKDGLTGAVTTGSDSKTVINDAIAACPANSSHTVYIKHGLYDITGQINIKNYTRLVGERMRLHEDTFSGTMFRKHATMTTGTIIGAADTGTFNLRQPLIRGISFYGVDQSVDAINLSSWMGRFEDCQMYQCNRAIFLQGISTALDDNRIYGNRMHECDRGIQLDTFMSASDIGNNVIGRCDKDGILVRGFSHRIYLNKIYECSRQASGFAGIAISALGDYSQIIDNQIEPDGDNMNCITIASTDYAIIARNRCKSGDVLAGRFGLIVSSGSDHNLIYDNEFAYNSVAGLIYGIDIRDTCANNDIINNKFPTTFTFAGGNYSPTASIQGNMIQDFGARSMAGDPTTSNLRTGKYQLWKNTTSGAVKLWYNDAGTMKGVTLA